MGYTKLTLWVETVTGESSSAYHCHGCGTVVVNRQLHDTWHDRVEPS